jgi:hypothetical protein
MNIMTKLQTIQTDPNNNQTDNVINLKTVSTNNAINFSESNKTIWNHNQTYYKSVKLLSDCNQDLIKTQMLIV